MPDHDHAAITAHLRKASDEVEGASYLDSLRLSRDDLYWVAAELGMTQVERLSRPKLRARILKQAITARRKYSILRNWRDDTCQH